MYPSPDGSVAAAVGDAVPTDASMLERCRSGDVEAWEQVVKRYERLVFSVALRNGLDREDASDVTQTTFLALLDSIDSIHEADRLSSWLMTVARRQSWSRRRRQGHEAALQGRLSAGTESLRDPITDWERTSVLYDGLMRLGAPCAELLRLLYFDAAQPSYAEIAERTGRAVGSLGPLRGRCLSRLRALLGEDEI